MHTRNQRTKKKKWTITWKREQNHASINWNAYVRTFSSVPYEKIARIEPIVCAIRVIILLPYDARVVHCWYENRKDIIRLARAQSQNKLTSMFHFTISITQTHSHNRLRRASNKPSFRIKWCWLSGRQNKWIFRLNVSDVWMELRFAKSDQSDLCLSFITASMKHFYRSHCVWASTSYAGVNRIRIIAQWTFVRDGEPFGTRQQTVM